MKISKDKTLAISSGHDPVTFHATFEQDKTKEYKANPFVADATLEKHRFILSDANSN